MKEYEVLQVDADASIEKMVQRLDNLQKMVDTPKVVAAAINSAARSTKNKIVKDTKERYATANDSVYSSSSALKVDAATGGDLTATLHSSGSDARDHGLRFKAELRDQRRSGARPQ